MTNKRASEILYDQWQNFLDKNLDYGGVSEAYKKAFEALEQEPILDKIRERIELEKLGYPPSAGYYKAIIKCLQIIEKYKTESEG